ncbi:MAG TPA: aminoacyl-histidine dipeptidase [Thermoanaerobaculia bacterium]|nr:aminoacyl-histidine dipeptidase [Thermoanaerobaculia bacterium]HUM30772.1 aminoacyl-histidine dipeptidase [Thermoanaerobaculia bacterium]HXK69028.1 aminoacyl-histidine dipeptidase [Thermoanaerobaculia bacterium]
MTDIESLQPQALWSHFSNLCAIPRSSRHEKAVAAYITSTAERHNLPWVKDKAGNVVVYKPAHPEKRGARKTILQGHMDMIWDKKRNLDHDFSRDPIHLRVESGYVRAAGTTLGADNGIGLAAALSVLESTDLLHGPLEFLFTVDEETGLHGAMKLDTSLIQGRRLLNLDTEEEDAFYVGCAGYVDTLLTLPIRRERDLPSGWCTALVTIRGLTGGHSGVDIHLHRGSSNVLAARVIRELNREYGARIVTVTGGTRRNAIARETEAIVALPGKDLSLATQRVRSLQKTFREEMRGVDDDVYAALHGVGITPYPPLTEPSNRRASALLRSIPHGVLSVGQTQSEVVETSTNFARVHTSRSRILIETSQRSARDTLKDAAADMVASMGNLSGARVRHEGGYTGWKQDPSSPTLRACVEIYERIFGSHPRLISVHGGLECGIFHQRIPNLDMVSFGPTIEFAHSPEERVSIASVRNFWKLLTEVLKELD